jgi:hypothetical protein
MRALVLKREVMCEGKKLGITDSVSLFLKELKVSKAENIL